MTVLMWEVRAAPGRLDDLVRWVLAHVPTAQRLYRSRPGDADERLVALDTDLGGPPALPADLVARPPHAWTFDQVR